jgi:hypothetical protein
VLHLQLRSPPGASAARSFGVSCRPQGDVGTGGQFAAVTLESGRCLPPREGCALAGPRARGAFLEIAGERALDWAGPRPRPASVGGAFADEQARLRRSLGLSKGGQVAGEHSFVRTGTSGRLARKDNDGQLHWRL